MPLITGWVLTKVDETDVGHKPLVASLSAIWRAGALPLPGTEWLLCQVKTHSEIVAYMKQDTEDFVWIGNERNPVPQQVLDAYASKLDPNATYQNLGQVLDKLAEWEPRFLLRVD